MAQGILLPGAPAAQATAARPDWRPAPAAPTLAWDRLALGGALLLAFVLRAFALRSSDVWWDEGLAVWAARQPLPAMAAWTAHDVHPPGYFTLLHLWLPLAGDGEFAIRFLSALVGTATVAALWKLGRVLLPGRPWVASGAALLLAVARFDIWWAQETRMYALAALLAVLHLTFTAAMRRRPTLWNGAGFVLTAVAALWTLYLLAFLLVIDGLYWLPTLRMLPTWGRRLRRFALWASLEGAAVAGFLPWFLYFWPRTQHWSAQQPFSPGEFAQLYATLLALGVSANVDQVVLTTAAVLALVAAGMLVLARRRKNWDALRLLLLAVLLPPLVVWLVTMLPRGFGYMPSPEARYFLPYAPAFALLAAWSLAALGRLARRLAAPATLTLFAALLALQLPSLVGYYQGRQLSDDYRSLTATMRAYAQPADAVVLHTDDPWPVFAYHWPGAFAGTPHYQDATPGSAAYFLKPIWTTHDAVWLVIDEDALRADPRRRYEGWLASRALAMRSWRFGAKRLVLYARTTARARTLDQLAPTFHPPLPAQPLAAGGLTVVGWEQPLDYLLSGTVANAAVSVARQGSGGALTVRLGTAASERLTVPPGQGVVRLPVSVLLPASSAPGRYQWTANLGGRQAALGVVQVTGGASAVPAAPPPTPQHPENVSFGQPPIARLLGYDLAVASADGRTVTLTLYWRAETAAPISYKVFTHLMTAANHVAAQRDDFPVDGQRPTTSWLPGEIIADRYVIAVPADVPAGSYTLTVGFYDPSTGARVSPVVSSAGQRLPNDEAPLGTVRRPGG